MFAQPDVQKDRPMASKLTVKVDTPSVKPYKVSGTTLEEIWNDIVKKGPKDGGKPRAGYTSAPAETPNDYKFDEEEDPKAKPKDGEAWKVTAKGGEIKVKPVIQIPELDSDKDLPDEDKKTWATFVKGVRDHEDEHVAATKAECEAVAKEIGELVGKGEGKDKKAAVKAAIKDWIDQYKAAFGGDKFPKRLKKVNEDLDTSGHGPVLKYKKSG
jgi:predicted secreted Zn-dependent protease